MFFEVASVLHSKFEVLSDKKEENGEKRGWCLNVV